MQADSYERFLRAAHRMVFAMDRRADRVLSEAHSGTFTQFLMLSAISKCAGHSQQKIATFLRLTPAAVSRQMDSLVDEKLIERLPDPQSRRAHVIKLTKTGEQRLSEMSEILMNAARKHIDVAHDDLEQATQTLEKVCSQLFPGELPITNH